MPVTHIQYLDLTAQIGDSEGRVWSLSDLPRVSGREEARHKIERASVEALVKYEIARTPTGFAKESPFLISWIDYKLMKTTFADTLKDWNRLREQIA